MKRREFLARTIAASSVLAVDPAVLAIQEAPRSGDQRVDVIESLAGHSLGQLRDQLQRDLFEDFLPFMDKYVIDHQYGGFMCDTDYNGVRVDENKVD